MNEQKKVANRLKSESAVSAIPGGTLDREDAEGILLSLEALRRMALQDMKEQKPALEVLATRLAAAKWRYPVKTLIRLHWLAAPLKLEGLDELPAELRPRAIEFGGPDLSLLISAMRQQGGRDIALLEKA